MQVEMWRKTFLLVLACVLSFGCFGQTNVVDSLVHQGFDRKYTIHTPPGFTNLTPVPVVLMLHGAGGTMLNSQNFTNLNSVSDAHGFLGVYPEGYGPLQLGFSWADGRGTVADQSGIDDVGFIAELIDVLINDYSADTSRIYICGFSNGGFMTQRLACESNARFAAMASLGCTIDTQLLSTCNPNRAIPMFLLGGTEDTFVPYEGGVGVVSGTGTVVNHVEMDALLDFWETNNACGTAVPPVDLPDINTDDNSTVTVFTFTDCACNATVKLYRVNGGGHTWPGVSNPIYEIIAGPTNLDISASEELWSFFESNTLCNSSVNAIETAFHPEFKIYPNPSTGVLNFQMDAKEQFSITFRNTLGQVIFESMNSPQIDISFLPSGLYLATVQMGQKVFTHRILKE